MADNTSLQAAKNLKDDEFYTTYESIVEELSHYTSHFEGKVILCNCDDPFESNFCKYFLRNFNVLGLKRLICTSYHGSKVIATQLDLFDQSNEPRIDNHGYVLDVTQIEKGEIEFSDKFIENWLKKNRPIKKLRGNGDFRSNECLNYYSNPT